MGAAIRERAALSHRPRQSAPAMVAKAGRKKRIYDALVVAELTEISGRGSPRTRMI